MSKKMNIIEDILSWKNELEVTGGREYTDEDLKDDLRELERKTVPQLRARWRTTVGEWVASRNDVNEEYNKEVEQGDFKGSFDDYLEEQLRRVEKGEEKAYGYTHPVSL